MITVTRRVGTNHFVTEEDAIRFYARFDWTPELVQRKIKEGFLVIGIAPVPGDGKSLVIEEGRYIVCSPQDLALGGA